MKSLIKYLLLLIIFIINSNSNEYYKIGHGVPLYVIHGGPMFNSKYLIEPLEVLSNDFELVFIDLPGRGNSTYPGDSMIGLQFDINSIEKIRNELNHTKINILGHSWGGYVALGYLQLCPQNVDKIIAVSTPIIINDSLFSLRQKELYLKLSIDTIKSKIDNIKLMTYLNIYDSTLVEKKYLERFRESILYHDTSVYFNNMRTTYNSHIYYEWNCIFGTSLMNIDSNYFQIHMDRKFLLIYGINDEIGFVEYLKPIKNFNNIEIIVYDNASHLPFYEHNKMFIKQVKRFLND